MYDIINKKKHNASLSREEIEWLVRGCTDGTIPDYQISAWLMAVCFNSMSDSETADLTMAMAHSGDMLPLFQKNTVDKHSTGGVGDKTTLVVAPIVASCGGFVAKMSGRGLGHTGGTIDKLESIPGFRTDLSFDEFTGIVTKIGCAVAAQSGHITPADKKLYALRDTTATVDSIPLIASSIMSKKLATGAHSILLDVKVGSGAFLKNADDAKRLAEIMINVGKHAGRKCSAILTDMNKPLGHCIGNSLEVMEAIEILKGNGCEGDLYKLCIELSARMLFLSGKGTVDKCRELSVMAVKLGNALNTFKNMIELQGGNASVLDDYSLFKKAAQCLDIISDEDGFISEINCEEIGLTAQMLGAGRRTKDEPIDSSAGIVLHKLYRQYVQKGETIATLYAGCDINIQECAERFVKYYKIAPKKPKNIAIIIE